LRLVLGQITLGLGAPFRIIFSNLKKKGEIEMGINNNKIVFTGNITQ
jgi:hypothetical protein